MEPEAVPQESFRILRENLAAVEAEIAASCGRAGRPREAVSLLPVVKSVDAGTVRLLHAAGVRDVGEGTLQGALAKRGELEDLRDLRWHLVGHLQRNKAHKAAAIFSSIHSLDSMRLAETLEGEYLRREGSVSCSPGPDGPGPILYLEINIAGEATKGGIAPGDAPTFLEELRRLPRTAARIRGLMTMAPEADDPGEARPHFRRLRDLRDRLVAAGLLPARSGLSMGMSGDYPVAIEEGATVVRVGTRIFRGLLGDGGPAGGGLPCR